MSENKNMDLPLIEVKNLKQHFPINVGPLKTKPLKAVDGVSFSIKRGETLGLVGESGCGKTTVGRTLLHLYKPTSGEICLDGKPVKMGNALKAMANGIREPKMAGTKMCGIAGIFAILSPRNLLHIRWMTNSDHCYNH